MQRVAAVSVWLAVALGGTGCPRRAEPEKPPVAEEWQANPGLLPKPAGRVLGERTTIDEDARLAEFSQGSAAPSMTAGSTEEEFIAAADAGQAWAQTRLGIMYARAPDDVILWDKAIRLFELAAAQGDAEALYELSEMASVGRGMPASDVTAFDYMKRAAEAGMAEAQYRLASKFSEGRGTVPDPAAAIEWGRRAAEQGHTRAQFTLGCLLISSPEAAKKQEALKWLDAATGAGERQATLFLATALARGEYDLPKDEMRSEQLLRPLAEKNDPEAQFVIAWLYMFGEKFAARRDEARGWLEKAATNGHPQAAGALASLPSPDQPKMRVEPTQPRS